MSGPERDTARTGDVRRVDWDVLSASELRGRARSDAIAIVPVGSTEQHGPHLPVQVDSLLCSEIARRGATLLEDGATVVLPPMWTGLAEHHMSFGGTITLDLPTFSALLRCILDSLIRQGFRRIFVLNGHGGNRAALNAVVAEFTIAHRLPIAVANYWDLVGPRFASILETQATVQHACEAETSMMLALRPDLVDMDRLAGTPAGERSAPEMPPGVYRWRSYESRTKLGIIGDPHMATAEKGRLLIDAAAAGLAAALSNRALWDTPT
ncbi:MAG: creatininase family protein [Dongiaceae bacterium]